MGSTADKLLRGLFWGGVLGTILAAGIGIPLLAPRQATSYTESGPVYRKPNTDELRIQKQLPILGAIVGAAAGMATEGCVIFIRRKRRSRECDV